MTEFTAVRFLLILLAVLVNSVISFCPSSWTPNVNGISSISSTSKPSQLFSESSSNNSNENNDVDEEDNMNLGDWRKFRAQLIASENDSDNDTTSSTTASTMDATTSKENELLLQTQNEELAKEEVWAHLIPEPEVGGLILRMPMEAELYWGTGFWKDKLDALLRMDTMGPPESLMAHWFPMAERMLARELKVITSSSSNNSGIINPKDLEPEARILLEQYVDYKQTWQEVCLMIGSTQAVIINRPISKTIHNQQLATLLLQNAPNLPLGLEDKLVQAFSKEGVVYMGGPDLQTDQPALLLHGIADLEGATELAPGTGIYMGGLEAAVEGVLMKKYKPLDFRFFLGRKVFDIHAGEADDDTNSIKDKIQKGSYKAVACNRSLALKQCLGLPKPLWHEVLELCGGDMKSVSEIEIAKRTDLR